MWSFQEDKSKNFFEKKWKKIVKLRAETRNQKIIPCKN